MPCFWLQEFFKWLGLFLLLHYLTCKPRVWKTGAEIFLELKSERKSFSCFLFIKNQNLPVLPINLSSLSDSLNSEKIQEKKILKYRSTFKNFYSSRKNHSRRSTWLRTVSRLLVYRIIKSYLSPSSFLIQHGNLFLNFSTAAPTLVICNANIH